MERLERKSTRTSIVEGMVTGATTLPVAPLEQLMSRDGDSDERRERKAEFSLRKEKSGAAPLPAAKHGSGLTDGDEGASALSERCADGVDAPDLPKNNLWLVMPA